MNKLFSKLIALALLVTALQSNEVYTVDTKSSHVYYKSLADILFFIDNTIISTNRSVKGEINVKENNLINGKVIINIQGFDSENGIRDSKVMDILGYELNPNIIFNIKKSETIDGQLFLLGDLKINAKTKAIKVPVIKTYIDDSITYTATLDVKYSDFGIEPPSVAGFIKKAKESVEIGATIRFVKTK